MQEQDAGDGRLNIEALAAGLHKVRYKNVTLVTISEIILSDSS
jgi:hypothetical protein